MSPLPTTKVIHPGWSTHHQGTAAATMTGTCVITRAVAGETYDPDTGSTTPAEAAMVYEGPCRVQATGGTGSRSAGTLRAGQPTSTRSYLVVIPVDSEVPAIGDRVTVEAPDDPWLTGKVLLVEGITGGTVLWQRNLSCMHAPEAAL